MLSKIYLQLLHIVQQWTNTLGLSCLWSSTNQEDIHLHLDLILPLVSATVWPDSRNSKENLCNSRLVIANWMKRRFLSTETKKLVVVNSPLPQLRTACLTLRRWWSESRCVLNMHLMWTDVLWLAFVPENCGPLASDKCPGCLNEWLQVGSQVDAATEHACASWN